MSEQTIPEYVRKRIERRPPEVCEGYIREGNKGFVPVVSDGDPSKAMVATVGLNPRRSDHLPSTFDPEGVWHACNNYFNPEWTFARKPKRDWVDNWAPILKELEVSYEDRSACNLDLVKWPLRKSWSRNPIDIRDWLLKKDVPFLGEQLQENATIKLVLGNGSTVKKQFQQALRAEIDECGKLDDYSTVLFYGRIPQRMHNGKETYKTFIGWNHFLSYPPDADGDKWRLALAKRVGELYRNGC